MWNTELNTGGNPRLEHFWRWRVSAGHAGMTLPLSEATWHWPPGARNRRKNQTERVGEIWTGGWLVTEQECGKNDTNKQPTPHSASFTPSFFSFFLLSSLTCWPAVVHSFHLIPWVKQIISPSLSQTTEGVRVHSRLRACVRCLWGRERKKKQRTMNELVYPETCRFRGGESWGQIKTERNRYCQPSCLHVCHSDRFVAYACSA